MQLKRLELYGFKSFADRTVLEFTPGITAVVGPNGSGKSNVSDAILWALGEQNVRHLRGEGAQDVIFAGAEGRRPLGLAEVSLCLDNSDRALPLDFGEVTITRRLYRSGDAEFFINRAACRLKDIYELFLDTGVGRDAYSIIGQNHIEQVLSARGEERRELFEEAAGIKKYRHRRREASRKLDNTRQNLLRVADILSELEAQTGPIGQQAETARQFQELDGRRRDLERGLLAVDLARARTLLSDLERERQALGDQIEACDGRRRSLEAEEERLRMRLQELDAAMHEARVDAEHHREAALRTETALALHRQRAQTAAAARKRLEEEIERASAAARMAAEDAGQAESALRSAAAAVAAAESSSREAGTALQTLESAARLVGQAWETERRKVALLAARKALLEGQAQGLERRIAQESSRAQEDAGGQDAEGLAVAAARRQAEDAAASLHSQAASLAAADVDLAAARAAMEEARGLHREAAGCFQQIQHEAVQAGARLRSLQEVHDSLEGMYRGVRAVFQAARNGALRGRFELVADLLSVPEEYRIAIEVALGAHVQDIVTDSDAEAQAAIDHLKRRGLGRATFLPLDLVRGDRMRLDRRPGVLGIASELIQYPPGVTRAIDTLLGRIVVVEVLPVAVRLARSGLGARLVTLDGEVVNPNGSLTGGSREGGPGILSRKLDIDRLRLETEERAHAVRDAEAAAAEAERAAQASALRFEEARAEAARLRLEVGRAESAEAGARKEFARLEQEIETAAARRSEFERRLGEERRALEGLRAEIAAVSAQEQEMESHASSLGSTAQARQQELVGARQSSTDAQAELARAREAARAAEGVSRRAEQTRRDSAEALRRRQEEQARWEAEGATGPDESALQAVLDTAREAAGRAAAQVDGRAREREALLQTVGASSLALRQAGEERSALIERSHRLEVRQAGQESDAAHITGRLQDEYGLSAADAAPLAALVPSRQNAAVEINRLKRDIAALGPVNVGAIEEFQRLTERRDFLSIQRHDLEEAEQTLLSVIAEIDEKTHETFHATYRRIQDAFDAMFQRLFGGGQTRLVLTDPQNLLETGIDIIVQPPGKKLQHLQLLSGGEKALTAVALLFALLEVKPSPFCLLDEVDAALDEANVTRFSQVVEDFAARSQFIIITHNKATMTAADTLFGVTMEQPGVSKIISVRLED